MAEFPTLGGRCSKEDCKQLDFLPFNCSHCDSVFCKEHFPVMEHGCHSFIDRQVDQATLTPTKHHPCRFIECSQREPLEMLCGSCNKHFCLKHRHPGDHACLSVLIAKQRQEQEKRKWAAPQEQFEKAKVAVDEKINSNLKSTKKKEMAAKVQLMRLKNRASLNKIGLHIPEAERLFLLVKGRDRNDVEKEAVVVSSLEWTLGRLLDECTKACSMPDTNRLPDTLLSIFHEDGNLVDETLSIRVGDIVEKRSLHNGQTVVLKYHPSKEKNS